MGQGLYGRSLTPVSLYAEILYLRIKNEGFISFLLTFYVNGVNI